MKIQGGKPPVTHSTGDGSGINRSGLFRVIVRFITEESGALKKDYNPPDTNTINEQSRIIEDLDLDSLDRVQLAMTIEEAIGTNVVFSEEDLEEVLGDIGRPITISDVLDFALNPENHHTNRR